MGITPTLIKGPVNFGPGLKFATYQVALDSAHATGGEPIDLTGEFDYIFAGWAAGNDTGADNGVKFDLVLPTATTAVSSTNVTITAYWSADGTDGESFIENTGDLSTVGQLSICIVGA
jgi:hypothetical protein